MALYGVVADIHGNSEALEAALAALERRGADRLLCLGDVVGYNADADRCAALLERRGALAIAGNHDLIALERLDFSRCSDKARHALKRTRRALAGATRDYLAALPAARAFEGGIVLVHGGVRDVQQYMVGAGHIRENAAYLRQDFPGARVCFFGHSHEQKVYRVQGERVEEAPMQERHALDRQALYFVNPGSVDASRKRGEKLAECAVFDSETWTLELLRLPYDAAATEAKSAASGYRLAPWAQSMHALVGRMHALVGRMHALVRRVLTTGRRRARAQ
jgi:predicted phosphodiesterase